MRVLVTGHRGFIGSHFVNRTLLSGMKIRGYDLVEGNDIRDLLRLDRFFEYVQPEVVVHLAALAGVRRGERFPEQYIATNILGTENVLRCAERYGVKKVIAFSSSSVYGGSSDRLVEDDERMPKSLYGVTKLASEFLCQRSPVTTYVVRPFTVYGEDGRGDMVLYRWINHIKQKLPVPFYGDGNSVRGYTYVGDLLDGVARLCAFDGESDTFNLGGKEPVSLSRLEEIFREVVPDMEVERLPAQEGDVYKSVASIEKAREILGFNPDTDFKTKVQEIVKKELRL